MSFLSRKKVVSAIDITANTMKRAPVSFKLCFAEEKNLVLNNKNSRLFLSRAYGSDIFPLEI